MIMRKSAFIFTIVITLGSCNTDESQFMAAGPDILHAGIEQDTKTSLDAGNNILWAEDDQVVAFMKTSYGHKYQVLPSFIGLTYADFARIDQSSNDNLSGGIEWDHNVVYYPYSSDVRTIKAGDEKYLLDITLPAGQTYAQESFGNGYFPMVAVSETNDITFRNICGGIKLQLKGNLKVASITIEGKNNEKLAGDATVTAYPGEEKPTITMSEGALTTATLNCGSGILLDEAVATEFIITLPPVNFEHGFTITVTTADSQVHTIETDKANEILRSTLLIMPPYALDASSPEPEDPSESYYVEVAESLNDWSGDYLVTYTSDGSITVFNEWDNNTFGQSTIDLGACLTADGIHSEYGDPHKSIVTKTGEFYSVNVASVGYIGYTGSKNSLTYMTAAPTAEDTEYLWRFSYKDGGYVWMRNAADDSRRLQWNATHPRFACYTGSQEELTFYRRGTASEGGTTPPAPEDPTPDQPTEPDEPGGGSEDIPTPIPGQSGKYGWYELPVINYSSSGSYLIDNDDADLYYAHHMCAGDETGPGGKQARNYTVCYSAEHHCPVWVAAPRHKMYESGASRTDAYGKDPAIPSDIQYNSKSTGGGCNKGHMLGSAERLSSTATNRQVFYYTNIAPQYMNTFNTGGGGWNLLEDWVDTKVCSDTLYVVIGSYFDKYTDKRGNTGSPAVISFGGRTDVSRPTMFYYILMRTKSGNSGKPLSECSSSEIMCAAFVRSHETPKGTAVSSQDMMSVSDLEKVTGFTYFPNVPQAPKSTYNASDWGL